MTFATRMRAGLGETFEDNAGTLFEDLVDGLTSPAETADALLQPATGGWPTVLDLATTPQPAWLGQLAGARIDAALPLAEQRAQVLSHLMWRRGTPAALIELAQTFLTGGKRVDITERDGSAWAVRVRVYAPQLINPATTAADIARLLLQAKPIGVTLTVEILPGVTWSEINTTYATWDAVTATGKTFSQLLTGSL
jgi:hypothetical protein